MKLITQGALAVGLLLIAAPASAQNPNGCTPSTNQPNKCDGQGAQAAPAPLVAAGIPGALVLFGGIVAARRARRRRNRNG